MPDPISAPEILQALKSPLDKLRVRRIHLDVIEGANAGDSLSATKDRVTLGSGEGCDLRLTDSTVSRFHCELTVRPNGTVRVQDLGSRNGCVIDGVWVERGLLHDGAVLALGNTRLKFSVDDGWLELDLHPKPALGTMVGKSPAMRRVFQEIIAAAPTTTPVLFEGEAHTGKELAALTLHRLSPRADHPFVVIDCATASNEAAELEIFGCVAAYQVLHPQAHAGALAAAHGGTILLKNIDALSLDAQKRLSNFLEGGTYQALGGQEPQTSTARVLATTTTNLSHELNHGRFRGSLYRSLSTATIGLPPLRDRMEDLEALTAQLLQAHGPRTAEFVESPAFARLMAKVNQHSWPGNLAELAAYLRKVARSDQDASLSHSMTESERMSLAAAREQGIERAERRYLEQLLTVAGPDLERAAQIAGFGVGSLQHLLSKHGLR